VQASYKKLDHYRMCDACLGRGLVKSVYNFMVLESNCAKCDSEGVLREAPAFQTGDSPLEEKEKTEAENAGRRNVETVGSASVGTSAIERIADQVDPALNEDASQGEIVPTSAETRAATAPPLRGLAASATAAPSSRDSQFDVDALLDNDSVD
jgi:hypothetical protein